MKILLHQLKGFLLVYITVFLFYLFSLQQNFSSSHDAITYLVHITEGKELFHPHHLVFNASAWVWLKAFSHLLPGIEDYYIIEAFNALWGSGIILVSYLFFNRRFKKDSRYSAIASTVIAFSYGVWCYSTNVEVYAPSIFFSLLILYILSGENLRKNSVYRISVLHIIAILFHQVNVLLYPVILLVLFSRLDRKDFFRQGLQYTLITGLLTLGMYIIAGVLFAGKENSSTLWTWMTYYATEQDYWHPPGISSLLYAMTGFGHAFIGGHFIFRMPVTGRMISEGLSSHGLTDEAFLVASMSPGFAWLLLILSLTLVMIMVYLLLSLLTRSVSLFRDQRLLYLPLLSTFIIYSLFFLFWNPENLEFWILQSVIVWLVLLGSRASSSRKGLPLLPAVIAALLFVINYGGSMKWLQEKEFDWFYKRVEGPAKISVPGDGIVLEDPWIIDGYTSYFMEGERITLDDSLWPKLRAKPDSGLKVFIFESGKQHSKLVDSLRKEFGERITTVNDRPPLIYIFQ